MSSASVALSGAKSNLALLVIVLGVLIAAVDTTIVVLALPAMQRSLHVGIASVIWVIIGYLAVITLLSTQVGKLGDMLGRVRMYEAGFLVFVLGSLLCALSWNEASIIGFRVLQGIGGALISANSGAVIADIFPPERRGRAYGFNSIGWNLGAILGIILGGFIVSDFSWRWVFWINVPIGLAAWLVALAVLRDHGERVPRKLDLAGMLALGLGILLLLWAAVLLISTPFDGQIAGLLLLGLLCLLALVWIERRVPSPMLRLDLFKIPTMTPSLLAALFQSLATSADAVEHADQGNPP